MLTVASEQWGCYVRERRSSRNSPDDDGSIGGQVNSSGSRDSADEGQRERGGQGSSNEE